MRDAGIIPDTTPDSLAAVAGVCPVFRVESVPAEPPGGAAQT